MKFGSIITVAAMGAVIAVAAPVGAQQSYNAPYMTQQSQTRMSQDMVSGSVNDLMQINLVGLNQNHLIGNVTVRDGRVAHVDFGPVATLGRLNLQNGDNLTVYGMPGTINDRPMLMANRIEARGQTLMVQMPADLQISPYNGRIVRVRTASFQDRNVPEQVFAQVQLDNGATTAVNLGPRSEFHGMDVRSLEGKQVNFLAHPTLIRGERALVADELQMEGQTIAINRTA